LAKNLSDNEDRQQYRNGGKGIPGREREPLVSEMGVSLGCLRNPKGSWWLNQVREGWKWKAVQGREGGWAGYIAEDMGQSLKGHWEAGRHWRTLGGEWVNGCAF
jgi:hypothetical protein